MSTFFGGEVDEARNESCFAGRKKRKEKRGMRAVPREERRENRQRESARARSLLDHSPLSWLVVRRAAQVCMYMYVYV
jgi:hypothetical protein